MTNLKLKVKSFWCQMKEWIVKLFWTRSAIKESFGFDVKGFRNDEDVFTSQALYTTLKAELEMEHSEDDEMNEKIFENLSKTIIMESI